MILPRTSARWAGQISQQSSKATPRSAYRHTRRIAQRRRYANASGEGGHSTHKSSSDLPWAIGSLVVTIPSVFYLIQPQLSSNKSHDHGHGDGGHGQEHSEGEEHDEKKDSGEEGESLEGEEEQPGNQGEIEEEAVDDSADGGGNDEAEEGGLKDESTGSKAPLSPSDKGPDDEVHETEGGGKVEGVQFKGATTGGEQGDTRKHIPDAKGGSKKRIESDYGNRQGEATEPEQDSGDKDLGAASKATGKAGSDTTQSSKQEGLSNTDTKHSIDIQNNPEKSNKGEGMPETAKLKGTVDPSRPQA